MHNERLFYLLCVEKLAPDHIKTTHRANASDSQLCYSKFSPAVVVLGSRQFPVYNFQLNFTSKLGKPIHEKKIIHLPN